MRTAEAQGKAKRNQARRLVLAYFERIGAAVWDLGGDVYRVELTPEQSGELEGGWTPPWSPGRPAQVTHYFTFTPEVADAHGEVELIGFGSHRLMQVIESIRRIGSATRLWLPAARDGRAGLALGKRALAYRPFYLFTLRLESTHPSKPCEARRIAVDRVDQIALQQLAAILPDLPLESGYPPDDSPVERPAADFARSFHIAFQSLLEALEAEDPSWALDVHRSVDREQERLKEYFSERARAGEEIEDERARRMKELDEARPKLLVRVQGVSELYLPVAREGGVIRHLAFETAAYRGTPIPSLR